MDEWERTLLVERQRLLSEYREGVKLARKFLDRAKEALSELEETVEDLETISPYAYAQATRMPESNKAPQDNSSLSAAAPELGGLSSLPRTNGSDSA